MKKTRLILAASLMTIGAFSTITMSSCSKDDVQCNAGYEGKNCDVESRAKFVKNWNANDVTNGNQIVYTCNIVNGANVTSVVISSAFSQNFFDHNINATVSGNTITIPQQTPDSNGEYKVSGSGTYSNGTINWDYIIVENSSGDSQTYSGVWN